MEKVLEVLTAHKTINLEGSTSVRMDLPAESQEILKRFKDNYKKLYGRHLSKERLIWLAIAIAADGLDKAGEQMAKLAELQTA